MALNNTTDESYPWTDSSIVLTWIQVPPNNWKKSVEHRVAIIQEDTSSAIRRHVPSQSNPTDIISSGIEPSTFTIHIVVEGTSQVITGAVKLPYNRGQQHQTHQSHCILQKIPQLQTSQGQQANNHSVHTSS